MKCMDCDSEVESQDDHWADCEVAPDFVRYQAKAERRVREGGPVSPSKGAFRCGHPFVRGNVRNHIDRGEAVPQERDCDGCAGR